MAVSSSTAFPLGVFVGNPNADDPAAEAVFDASYKAFTTLMGVQATYMDAYGDSTQPIDEWASNASWSASSYENSPVAKTMIPVIGLPMSSTAAGQPSADQTFKNFAAGDYDSMLQSMVKSWAAAGFLTQYWRPGVEMNLAGSPSYAGSDAATQADWVAAFQHIYTVLHAAAAADGVKLQVIWNPGVGNDSAVGNATQTIYPGNNYVDIIGADVYGEIHPYGTPTALYDWDKSGQVLDSSKPVYDSSVQQWASDPVNLAHYYTYPASDQWALDGSGGSDLSLQNLIDFAKAQGKPIAIPETGAGNNDGSGVSDNPTFVQWLYNTLTTSGVPVSFVNIWDSNGGGTYEFSQTADDKPLEAAAWAKYFGAQSGTSTGSQTGTLSVTPTTTSVTTTDAASAKVFSAIVVSDTNSGQTETVSVTPSTTANGTLSDPNAATDGSKIANGIWTVTGSAAAVAVALDGLTFKPTAHEVAPGKSVTTTFAALIKDTAGLTTTTSSTLTATAVATPITVTPATSSVATTGVASAKVFSGVVITDPNSGQNETATVTPSTLLNGTLVDPNAATDGSKITNGIWSITGSATAVATAMNGLTFKPIAQAVTTNTAATTTFSAVIKDTAGLSASAKSTVTATTQVTSISVSPATESVATANTSSTKVFSGLVISDP